MKKRPIKEFKGVLGKIERFVDKCIPFALIAITIILILENPFWILVHLENYEPWIGIIDLIIVLFFVVDLIFKWFTVRHWKKFVKLYWIDIIAVFPFYLATRAWISIASLVRLGEEFGEGQKFLHEFLLLRETELVREARLVRETELFKEFKPFMRALRSVQRFIRFVAGRDLEKKDVH